MNDIGCPVCGTGLRISPAKSRKAKNPKAFLMLICPVDGRHFRGFINDRDFVASALESAENLGKHTGEQEG